MMYPSVFTTATVINEAAGLNAECNALAAMQIAAVLRGLTEVICRDGDGDVAVTSYYKDGKMVAAVPAGQAWGPELTALIDEG